MLDDGLYARFPLPAVVLGQHVMPLPAGVLGVHAGPAFAAADSLRVVLHGRGGHGSRPENAVDPVLLAAATVLRLQGIVSREVAAGDTAVLTVGALHAGTASNIIPDRAELLLAVAAQLRRAGTGPHAGRGDAYRPGRGRRVRRHDRAGDHHGHHLPDGGERRGRLYPAHRRLQRRRRPGPRSRAR